MAGARGGMLGMTQQSALENCGLFSDGLGSMFSLEILGIA